MKTENLERRHDDKYGNEDAPINMEAQKKRSARAGNPSPTQNRYAIVLIENQAAKPSEIRQKSLRFRFRTGNSHLWRLAGIFLQKFSD